MSHHQLPQNIAILGAGVSGKHITQYLIKQGVEHILICDENKDAQFEISAPNIRTQFGPQWLEGIEEIPLIFRSPGIHPQKIWEKNIPKERVTTATKWFFHHCPAPITAITGSNGKSTTTALLHEMMKKQFGDMVIRGGNDGIPLLECMDEITPNHQILMELSSFQLFDIDMSPHIAVLLNVSPNHLDWHTDMDCYSDAKCNIFRFQNETDICVTDVDNSWIQKRLHLCHGKELSIGKKSHDIRVENGNIIAQNETIIHIDDIRCKTHIKNVFACVLAALSLQMRVSHIRDVLSSFGGIPHRIEHITEIDGKNIYNDSASTTPSSTIMAINQFDADKSIFLLGGRDKGMDFTDMFDQIAKKKLRVYLYGEMGPQFWDEMKKRDAENLIVNTDISSDFDHILDDVLQKAHSGDNIVFSPACTSFDMFENAKKRGQLFTEKILQRKH